MPNFWKAADSQRKFGEGEPSLSVSGGESGAVAGARDAQPADGAVGGSGREPPPDGSTLTSAPDARPPPGDARLPEGRAGGDGGDDTQRTGTEANDREGKLRGSARAPPIKCPGVSTKRLINALATVNQGDFYVKTL